MTMKVGVNWSGHSDTAILIELLNNRHIDFVEILIDNFLTVDPRRINSILDGIPVNFHIMNSQFIHKSKAELEELSGIINRYSDILLPNYISDHIGVFYHECLPLPVMAEIDYCYDLNLVARRLDIWQKCLGTKILIENYPSAFDQGIQQAQFYENHLSLTGAQLLFDISNAVVAQFNTGSPVNGWNKLIADCSHFHIAGYEFSSIVPVIAIDSHAANLSVDSIHHAERILSSIDKDITVSVERDGNLNYIDLVNDIVIIRGAANRTH